MPEISVIVPVYNTDKYLRRCIDSVLSQTFPDFELLLIDDGSTDESGDICDEYSILDDRVKVFHQINQGQGAARNVALDWVFSNSESQYISFVDSDDWIHPQYLELLKEAMVDEYEISACDLQLFKNLNEISIDRCTYSAIEVEPEYIYTRGEKQVYTYVWGKLYDKSLWKDIRFPVGIRWEDLAIFHRVLFLVAKVALIDQKLYYYFRNPAGTVFSEWRPWKLDFIHVLEKLLKDPIIKQRPAVFKAVQYTLARSLINRIFYLEKKEEYGNTYHDVICIHRRILQRFLIKYHREFMFTSCNHLYSVAFPQLMWIYWTSVGVCRKIKRIIKGNAAN